MSLIVLQSDNMLSVCLRARVIVTIYSIMNPLIVMCVFLDVIAQRANTGIIMTIVWKLGSVHALMIVIGITKCYINRESSWTETVKNGKFRN